MRRTLSAAALLVVLAGCSSSGSSEPSASTASPGELTPGFDHTDCAGIEAGDRLTAEAVELLCQPDDHAELSTLDCSDGTYVLLRRPAGDLEGIIGQTAWRAAAEPSDETGAKTPWAFEHCIEQDR